MPYSSAALTTEEKKILSLADSKGVFNCLLNGGTPNGKASVGIPPHKRPELSILIRAVSNETMRGYLAAFVAAEKERLDSEDEAREEYREILNATIEE